MTCNGKPETTAEIRARVVRDVLRAREQRERDEIEFAESAKRLSGAVAAYNAAMATASDLLCPAMKHDEILVSPVDPRFGLAKSNVYGDRLLRLVPLVGVPNLDSPGRTFAIPTSRAQGNPTLCVQMLPTVKFEAVVVTEADPDRHRPVLDPRAACNNKTVVDLG